MPVVSRLIPRCASSLHGTLSRHRPQSNGACAVLGRILSEVSLSGHRTHPGCRGLSIVTRASTVRPHAPPAQGAPEVSAWPRSFSVAAKSGSRARARLQHALQAAVPAGGAPKLRASGACQAVLPAMEIDAEQRDGSGEEGSEELCDDEVASQTSEPMPLYRFPSGPLPAARDARVKSAVFLKSSSDVSQCPPGNFPEVAVIGRSNVGKSSLINMLTNRKDLAQTSKKPGKTQLINHFLINDNWYLVDLPGYGYAVAPSAVRDGWNSFTKKYFLDRPNLASVLLLVDASIPPLQVDLDCADWLGQHKIPVTIVFTKCDRKKKKKNGGRPPSENVREFEVLLGEYYEEAPPWIMTSSVLGMGKDTLLAHMAQLRSHWRG